MPWVGNSMCFRCRVAQRANTALCTKCQEAYNECLKQQSLYYSVVVHHYAGSDEWDNGRLAQKALDWADKMWKEYWNVNAR
jgi:hypothetical protein